MESPMRRSLALLLFVLLAWPAWAPAQSGLRTEGDPARGQGLYEAEVPVAGQGDGERKHALERALGVVLGKLTGDPTAAREPAAAAILRKADQLVAGYDYRQDQGTTASGIPTFRTVLVAHFRAEEVDALAAASGLPIWPQPRPKPVLWLAIDDGGGAGPRLVGLGQANAARSLLDRAIARGFRLGLPTGTAAEQALVGAIWRQDTTTIARASARYSPPMQLIGKLYRHGNGWKADWVFVDGGRELARWSTALADARRTLAGGADGAADALAKRYAKVAETGRPGHYRVSIRGLRDAEDYVRVSAALQQAGVVRAIRPLRASGDRLELELDLLTGPAGLDLVLGESGPLEPLTPPPALPLPGEAASVPATAPAVLEYRVR